MFEFTIQNKLFSLNMKGLESLSQTLISNFLYLWNPLSGALDISNYEPCQIKYSKFEILNVYIIRLQGYKDTKNYVCGKDSIPLVMKFTLSFTFRASEKKNKKIPKF